ncbi:sensor histidine kinase [Piscinibacter sp.]|uniref:sensor histidine kinase n=1 Tax=Piscinibacter sp. TaxID=1903157 RepID=UPI002CD51803|nr:ATP-binding protein [Albitalea sp.]HUG24008.1 ATP-binding protein [Albitalea sp.]
MRSDRMVLLGVLAPLVLAIAVLLAVCIGGFHVLSAMRAYVGGESLWSKGRAAAVAHLRAHAATGHAADYRRFHESLAVMLGGRTARLELEKPQPDLAVVRAGLLAGEHAADDIPGMIRLYRYFRHVDFMEEAIGAWTEGDRLIEQLQALGLRIHLHVERGDSPAVLAPLLADLDAIDGRLVTLEKYFSATLGRASRKTEQLLLAVSLGLAALLAFGGGLLMRRSMRQQMADRELLLEANHRWEIAAEAAGIGLFDWHVAEDRFEVDERAAALYGVPAGTSLKRSEMRALTHADDRALVRSDLDEAIRSGRVSRTRFRLRWPDSSVHHLEAIGRVRDWGAHDKACMIGVVRDVGSEVAQAQLRVDKEAAERAARLRMEFLSRMSHELRTPLNAVLGVAQLLRIDPAEPLSASQSKRVDILQESGEALLRLVEGVLDVTRLDAGAVAVQSVPTDMAAAVRAGLNIVDPERARFAVRIDDRMPHRPVMVRADSQRLQQVFVNLLSNGCKYNRRGGTLSLQCREDEKRACVLITDEGRGMTPEQIDELFQPFKRFSASPDAPGIGLGLVVAKLLLEQMHGSIAVESAPGRGSCFTVSLERI